MPQQGLGTVSRQDILLPEGSQPDGATVLFIYSGEVRCNFFSDSNNTLTDQLQILLDAGITDEGQIVGFQLSHRTPHFQLFYRRAGIPKETRPSLGSILPL
jgi:hypothetical protein